MSKLKENIINHIIQIEGGYVNDVNDSGGETNFGITKEVARANGYNAAMLEMPKAVAFEIYADKYWDAVRSDALVALSEAVASEVVDTGVNMDPRRAILFLQRSLNALNSIGTLYDDIEVDGQIGNATISALKSYLAVRDESVLVKMLNCMQGAFYIELSERTAKDEAFIYGWFKNRVVIKES